MKKTSVFLTSLCMLSAAATLMAEPVPSVNAVGYVNVTLPPSNGYVMVSSPFDSVTGSVQRTLLDIFGSNSGLRQSGTASKVDRIYLWDTVIQQYVIFGQSTNGNFYLTTAFGVTPTNPVIPRGYGFFIKSPTAGNGGSNTTVINIAGQVPSAVSNVMSVIGASPTAPYQFLSNPYPTRSSLIGLICSSNGAIASAQASKCDRVYLWDTVIQQYVIVGLRAATNALPEQWVYTTSFAITNMPDLYLDPGQAFFYRGKTNFTWATPKKYVWP